MHHLGPDREALLNRWHQLDNADPDKIIVPDVFDWLVDTAEDIEDRRELAEVLAENDFVPWEEAKAELGLD